MPFQEGNEMFVVFVLGRAAGDVILSVIIMDLGISAILFQSGR